METVSILGSGLMGSSLGLALKQRGAPVRVRVYARRTETREAALSLGVADEVFSDPVEAVRNADLVVLCVPVLTIPALAEACLPGLKKGAIVTDVGSTKTELVRRLDGLLSGSDAVFIGSHPICGSDQQGIEAGNPDLYQGAMTVITPQTGSPQEAVEKVSNLWKRVGSSVTLMPPEEHDRILAATSHLPHVAAAALVLAAGDNGLFCGSGFRDTTRIAGGSPEVWSDIVRTNAPALMEALDVFRKRLDELEALIQSGDGEKLAAWFAAARDQRKKLLK